MNSDGDPPWSDRCGFFPLDSTQPILDQNTGNPLTYTDSAFPGRTCHAYQGLGFGNSWANHNFAFTSELRYWFQYQGNEKLKFTGDDDVWVFINGILAVDLGGVHNRAVATVTLDASKGTAQIGYGDTPSSYATIDFKAHTLVAAWKKRTSGRLEHFMPFSSRNHAEDGHLRQIWLLTRRDADDSAQPPSNRIRVHLQSG